MVTTREQQPAKPGAVATRPAPAAAAQADDVGAMIQQLDELATQYGPQALAPLSMIARSVKLAEGVKQAKALVGKVLPHIKHLAGTQLGFRTDRDSKPESERYTDQVLAECLTEAVLRGVSWVGNQFNVISGRCYVTKEGYLALVGGLPGLTDLRLLPGVPRVIEGGAVVPFKATWRFRGRAMELDRQIPVRLNSGMGADAAIGKATRKMLASVFHDCTGSEQSGADSDDEPLPQIRGAAPAAAPPEPPAAAELPPGDDGRLPGCSEPTDTSALQK